MLNTSNISSRRDTLLGLQVFLFSSNYFDTVSRKEDLNKLNSYEVFRKHTSLDTAVFELSLTEEVRQKLEVELEEITEQFTDCRYYLDKPVSTHASNQDAEFKREYFGSIKPMLESDLVKKTAENFLSSKNEDCLDCEEASSSFFELKRQKKQSCYRLMVSCGNVYIIVEEGFLKFLEDKTSKKAFYSDVLKAMYSLDRINNVNRTTWYRKYVEVLCSLV